MGDIAPAGLSVAWAKVGIDLSAAINYQAMKKARISGLF
jgi:hypothetical protein